MLDATETVIAANGSVSIAPVGTTLPTDAETALDTAFKDLGYISEDGVTFTPSIETDGLPAWQSLAPIRIFLTAYTIEVAFECLQWNADTLPLFFGGGEFTDAGDGTWTYLLPKPGELRELTLVIDGQDGDRTYRIVLDRVMLSDAGDLTFLRSDAAKLPVTVTALAGTTESRPGAIYANEPVAEPAP
jgi:hypothetical protein